MKSGLFFVALVGAFAVVAGGPPDKECPLIKALKESIDACIDKLSDDSARLMEADEFADNEEIRCFQACVMAHSGIMNDGKMDFKALEGMLSEVDAEHKAEAKEIVEIMKSCQAESETTDNECELAGKYAKCLKSKKLE